MPELPEVETIVRELKPRVAGKKFWGVEGRLRYVFSPSYGEFSVKIKNLKILDVVRRGKFIVFVLEKKMRLVIHLRMSGRLMWKKVPKKEKHIRAVFNFTDGTFLIFSDARKFGRIWLYLESEFEEATGISKLGIEPFSAQFKPEILNKFFVQKRGILKNTLLRQDLIAGIGNIYADEICHRIGLHPSTRLEQFEAADTARLYEAVIHCLQEGIAHNGASVSDFVGTRGTLGKHQHYLKVYGRKGDPCYVCGSKIQKTKVAGRGTFVCLKCQVLRLNQ